MNFLSAHQQILIRITIMLTRSIREICSWASKVRNILYRIQRRADNAEHVCRHRHQPLLSSQTDVTLHSTSQRSMSPCSENTFPCFFSLALISLLLSEETEVKDTWKQFKIREAVHLFQLSPLPGLLLHPPFNTLYCSPSFSLIRPHH